MDFTQLLQAIQWPDVVRALLLVLAGLALTRVYRRMLRQGLLSRLPPFGRRLGNGLIMGLFGVAALHQLGFNLSVLLGAAGVVSVAIGFASQTSAANLISGLFVVSEGSFHVGDTIQVGGTTGQVLSVDMLSVKLRTADNRYVRIPNESIIKGELVNLSKFPIRRIDLVLSVAHGTDISRARQVLAQVAAENPLCLEEPQPAITLERFAENSVDINFQCWAAQGNVGTVKDSLQEQLKTAFEAAGIRFPQRTLQLAGGPAAEQEEGRAAADINAPEADEPQATAPEDAMPVERNA